MKDNSSMSGPDVGEKHLEAHIENIWTNILNQDLLFPDCNVSHYLRPVDPNYFESVLNKVQNVTHTNHLYDMFVGGTNVVILRKTLEELFVEPRFTAESRKKTADAIFERLSLYTLETQKQKFVATGSNGRPVEGTNVIGVIPGRNRGQAGNGLIVIGAHYDTVQSSPGVDDNGSGVVALLETARILSPKMGRFNNTIIFVAFDLGEKGILGSLAFVNQFLIPHEIVRKRGKFIGAYIADMVMNFDANVGSQVMPLEISMAVTNVSALLQLNGLRGDFLSIWARRTIDWELWYNFQRSWAQEEASTEHRLTIIDPPIPRVPLFISNWRYRNFMRSDHAAFWNHKNPAFKDSLKAVLITDMGPWRGNLRACYHEFCDDRRQITLENLDFLRHVIDSLASAVATLAE
ncbi:uncharacterized protein B4U79_01234 [Dinothrombium tinctorium]|uniref:Peptidase M28 domain-containing protein n=2 Tax=Dinothrombium tinctorium TaxID=1965070 RepID=A0A443R1C3_9ACAR|nr:uncharacterized protein B4U79_01234 [Dinothrombium tinctorium]